MCRDTESGPELAFWRDAEKARGMEGQRTRDSGRR